MEGFGPQLLDLIPKQSEWIVGKEEDEEEYDEEKTLELRLGPPVDGFKNNMNTSGAKRVFSDRNGGQTQGFNYLQSPPCSWQQQLHQSNPKVIPVMAKESSHPCSSKANEKKKTFSPSPANITAVSTTISQKRSAAPVVGWPPIRSYRKNLSASCTSKPVSDELDGSKPTNNEVAVVQKQIENAKNGFFVKINMDGVPIGRKIDLKAYDSYEKLSSAVDELFRGLLAAQTQSDSSANGMIKEGNDGGKTIVGLLDGTGEYTLVYEDNEGDRVLVGDVPWHMFVSTVRRLRVLKSSDIPKLFFVGSKHGKTAAINDRFG